MELSHFAIKLFMIIIVVHILWAYGLLYNIYKTRALGVKGACMSENAYNMRGICVKFLHYTIKLLKVTL